MIDILNNLPRTPPTNTRRIAAFFDIDGTLLAGPSLERRLFANLRYRRVVPARNYFLWLAHSFRLAPRGLQAVLHANKMYLRGVIALSSTGTPVHHEARRVYPKLRRACVNVSTVESESASPSLCLSFLPAALDQAAWHAAANHAIILVSGTLAPLAHQVALALTLRLAARNFLAQVGVCATKLGVVNQRWTGRIAGDAMFGQAKARAIHHIAATQNFDLRRCYAYGDSLNDRWMLGAVGRPAVVNPSKALERVARLNDWPVLRWQSQAHTPQAQSQATQTSGTPRHSVPSSATKTHPATETSV
jgi:HAD superfamily phosphoserine phosphatase-like hydrolase